MTDLVQTIQINYRSLRLCYNYCAAVHDTVTSMQRSARLGTSPWQEMGQSSRTRFHVQRQEEADMGKAKSKTESSDTQAFAMMAGGPAATSAWLAVMNESARFVTDRLREDMKTQQAMLACKNPAELLQVQVEFYQTAIQQYTEEANRMFQTLSTAAEESISEAKSTHSRGYDDIPL